MGGRVSESTDFEGLRLEPDTMVLCWLGSANRDPEVFQNPETFDIARRKNRHVALSIGTHFCLGASLARLEAVGEFLAAQFSVERVQAGGFEDLAPFLPFFAIHPHELSDAALQWCGRELERSFRSGRLSPLEAGRLFVRSVARSLPATRLDGRRARLPVRLHPGSLA